MNESSRESELAKARHPVVYLFFLVHMGMFGIGGFLMSYAANEVPLVFMYMHGDLAVCVYTVFYVALFGIDEVKWILINTLLGLAGIYTQIGWILSLFGKQIDDYSPYVHAFPILYFVLYTFLLRQALLDLTRLHNSGRGKKVLEFSYVVILASIYVLSYVA